MVGCLVRKMIAPFSILPVIRCRLGKNQRLPQRLLDESIEFLPSQLRLVGKRTRYHSQWPPYSPFYRQP
jgi:hypothetical protein